MQLLFAKWLPVYALEEAWSGFSGDEYVRAAEWDLQGAGFYIKQVEVDTKFFYHSFVL